MSYQRRRKQRPWWRMDVLPNAPPSNKTEQLENDLPPNDCEHAARRLVQAEWLKRRGRPMKAEFTGQQKRMLRQWFNALDTDKSGMISVEELEDPMLSIGIVSDVGEVRAIIKRIDGDGNGQIDFDEFVHFLTPPSREVETDTNRHELMFRQLTKKMEYQSAGFLDINTQLSMDRRRFILDKIMHQSGTTINEELAELKSHKFGNESNEAISQQSKSPLQRAKERREKLEALCKRHHMEVRYQALENILLRKSPLPSNASAPALPRLTNDTLIPMCSSQSTPALQSLSEITKATQVPRHPQRPSLFPTIE